MSAGYVMGKIDINKLRLIAGVRDEKTEIDLSGNDVMPEGGVFSHFRPLSNDRSYTNVLPSLHARYHATDQLVFRAAWSSTVSRPVLSDIAPRRELQLDARNPTANVGNPDLEPFESTNYDLSAEYYMARLGIVSVGLFYKDIENTSFNVDMYVELTKLRDEPFYEYFGPINGSQRLPYKYEEYDWNANVGVKWEL